MKLIAHRGNFKGQNEAENHPDNIQLALDRKFDAEIDIWYIGGKWFLGHDRPRYLIDIVWIGDRKDKLWLHCKNFEGLNSLIKLNFGFNYFWHENDSYSLTSKGYVWKYPEVYLEGKLEAWCSDNIIDLTGS